MANRPAPALVLRAGDQEKLERLTRASTASAASAKRARIVLLAAEGVANTHIAERVGVVPPESWRASLCGFPVGGRGVLVADRAHHPDRAVPSVVVVEPVAPVQHDGLGLAGVVEIVA